MSRNATLLRNLEASARKLGEFVAGQVRQSEERARDRAHLSTRHDRPYAGCHPCEPLDGGVSPAATANPAAVRHGEIEA